MYDRFREKAGLDPKARYNINGMNLSGYSVLKLASIIEKETMLDRERAKVSSVFINRMKSKEAYEKRLESCATVRYALNKKQGALTYRDLRFESPYNTYIYIGLPPTPICNPGVKSIEAALRPAVTDYRYFVLRENGEHTFSRTLEEHNAVVRRNRALRQGR
ncbi:MAG TPA: endolytic transglycosylase MltG [bacterium]|nr:endolytic transglycosylase MltG [bacterium]